MNQPLKNIPFYEDINDFLESISQSRTKTPLFHCFRLKGKVNKLKYKAPYRKGFHTIVFVTNVINYQINYNNKTEETHSSFLIFQSPGQLMSYRFKPGLETKGYIICFKTGFLSFFKQSYLNEFPYLRELQSEVLEVKSSSLIEIEASFEDLFSTYEKAEIDYEKKSALKLVLLQYLLKDAIIINYKLSEQQVSKDKGTSVILQSFLNLIEIHYLEKRAVSDYAELLTVSPSYLSVQIKKSSQRGALSFINQRIILEAKSLLRFTDFNINEISDQLFFSDTSNFIKYFKKYTGFTPVQFKKKHIER